MLNLPYNANQFIKNNFETVQVLQLNEINKDTKHPLFRVDLVSDGLMYHLEFNSNGDLINFHTEPLNEDTFLYGEDL